MIRMILALLAGLLLGVGVTDTAYAAPVEPSVTCTEDMPCWRAWMGDGQVGPMAPPYMFLPSGPEWDALAPLYGYIEG
ncbi:hypothetical protein NN3_21690 [Nocardia neocaledoniensis NBRC 108232]|uniref:Peptidase inhibitor family I36 n=1 Tax=Nocardia neocaledoniensis TaxID=236511 RepID=A0A317NCK2_9NOCA|nr:hypothetical protein [Nocardia neocaledoniensis]PWV72790.1 hypothetical protein DFR69_108102 [Nocardia neocaledoniensis]GEM31162.1 hypothetical protein NN3_21690 [Nocardia neocaledoniensis NBRC 108232]